jgi:putative phosphoesterase
VVKNQSILKPGLFRTEAFGMSTQVRNHPRKDETSYCKFGAETILRLIRFFDEQLNGVAEDKDIEYVHRTRVTSRRLRAAMPLFRACMPKKQYKQWLKEIKNVTKLLGNARDLDVQIIFLEKYIENLGADEQKLGIETLLKDHLNQRKLIQPYVAKGMEKLRATNALTNLENFFEKTEIGLVNCPFYPQIVLGKALWQISFRLDDFLNMERYVHQETQKTKHHEMRIGAKKLRYTMETFAPLYKGKLSKEIETFKEYQDVLGEMHDCDVWREKILQYTEKRKKFEETKSRDAKADFDHSLAHFATYIKQKRKQLYKQFVRLWENNKKSDFFSSLRDTLTAASKLPENARRKVLSNPNIKIALISDVHANLQALETVLDDADLRGADLVINAGDIVGFGPCPNEAIELLCEKNVVSVLGNFDLEVLEASGKEKGEKNLALKFARKALSESHANYLSSLPREITFEVSGKKIFLTHGSPESIDEHIYHDTPEQRLKELADKAKADFIIIGHSHEQFLRHINGVSFINPGSVGRPGDENPQTAYALLSLNPFSFEHIRLDYNVNQSANILRKKGLPESFAQMLLRGVSLGTILTEDQQKEESIIQDCKGVLKVTRGVSKKYWPDIEHYRQVRKLALELFQGLTQLYQFGMRELCWLTSAAILHDIGLSKKAAGHHKTSTKLILNDRRLPFSSKDRRAIASIARYHRKALPKQNDYILFGMDREFRNKVIILASLLRVADSLDYTHQSLVRKLKVIIGKKRVNIEYTSENKAALEEERFNNKKDLLEKVSGKRVVLVWKRLPKN